MNINEKYQNLLKKKQKIDNDLNKLLSHAVVCTKCGYCVSFEEIDPKCLIANPYTSYDDAGTNFYYECDKCDIQREMELTKDAFMKILKLHGLTYEQWINKYPKNYIYKHY